MKKYPYICSGYLNARVMEQVFEPSRVISPDAMPIPKEGHIGYVKFENPYDYATLNPRFFEVDSYEVETVL